MSDLSILSDNMANGENTPLPLIVAHRWNFLLAHIQTDAGMFYAVQDWMRGLSGESDTRKIWSYFKKQDIWNQMSCLTRRLPYVTSNRKTYKRDYTTDKGLYLIAQYMRVKHDRPMLDALLPSLHLARMCYPVNNQA